jgi:type IX secretion system PorP/SprF family membrane protein
MKELNKIVTATLFLISNAIFAQQEASFTQYRNHMNIVNPAYVTMDNEATLSSTLRDQWTGVPNAPLTQAVSFGTPVGRNLGLGLSVVNNENFVEKQTLVAIDFSYKVQLNETIDLYLGIKAGGDFYNLNTSGLKTYNIEKDPALADLNTFTPNIGLGAVLKSENYYISLSSPRILSTERAKNEAGYATVATDRPHIYLSGGYNFDLNSTTTSLVLKPSIMIRYVKNAPASVDFTTMLQISENFEIGAMYRTDQAIGVITDFKINKHLLLGYSYEWSTRSTLASAQNTYELLLQYRF